MHPYAVHALRLARSARPQVVYDTETTGLDNAWEPAPKIWDLAAIRRGPGIERTAKGVLIRIGMPIPPAANLRHVDPNLPDREGVDPIKAYTAFARHISGAILVGHNIVDFDNRLMAMTYADLGLPIPIQFLDQRHCIDTLTLARGMFPRNQPGSPPDHKLLTMGLHLGVKFDATQLHGALADTSLSELVLDALLARAASEA